MDDVQRKESTSKCDIEQNLHKIMDTMKDEHKITQRHTAGGVPRPFQSAAEVPLSKVSNLHMFRAPFNTASSV